MGNNSNLKDSLNNPNKFNIDKLIKRVCWGKVFIKIDNKTYILRQLSIKEQNYIDFIHSSELQDGMNLGLVTEDELKKIYYKDETWTNNDENAINIFRKEIKKLNGEKSSIRKNANTIIRLNKINKKIILLEQKLNDLINRKYDLFKDTAEHRANEQSQRLSSFYMLQDQEENQIWININEFNKYKDMIFIHQVINKYYSNCFLNEKTIRRIARSALWRYKWQMCKNSPFALFGKASYDLTMDQNNLIYWSQAYDIVYESMERPPKSTIENDSKLDVWFDIQSKKIENDAVSKHHGLTKDIPAGKVGHQELFILTQDKDEVEEIQELNDPLTRAKVRNEQKKMLNKKDMITERELRKNSLILQAREQGKRER